MWSIEQSDQIFSAIVEHPRLTMVVPSGALDVLQFPDTDALAVAAAIRDRADAMQVPIIVRTRAVEDQPGQMHVIVYHVPDMTPTVDAGVDGWENEGGSSIEPVATGVTNLGDTAHA